MKIIALLLILLGFSHSVLGACDPVLVSREIAMSCSSNLKTYMIKIFTLKSSQECSGSDALVSKKAIVTVYASNVEVEKIEIADRDFSYTLTSQYGTFTSPINGLYFPKCNILPGGGISIGN